MKIEYFSTHGLPLDKASRVWQDRVSQTLFDLNIDNPKHNPYFSATLENWPLAHLSLSRICSDPARYTRTEAHIQHATQEELLITLNNRHPVQFQQLGREITCHTGNFLLELSHQPYRFISNLPLDVYVLKIPKAILKSHLCQPERYAALEFNSCSGMGHLFRRHLLNTVALLDSLNHNEAALIEQQLLQLFVHAVSRDDRVLHSSDSAIRAAHLLRIEQYANAHLEHNDLSCEHVAAACGISVRYLHLIFKDTGHTFSDWLRQCRLQTARRQLQSPHFNRSLAQLAHSLGFTDQSHFSKAYRRHFGESPRDTLLQSQHSAKQAT